VTLAPVPVLVSGVVLSPSGAPCERAGIEVQTFDAQGSFVDRKHLATAADGRFEVLDWPQGLSRLELTVRHGSGVNVLGRRIAPGTSGLRLVLEQGGSLVGQVLVDDPEVLPHLMCHLIAADGTLALRVPVWRNGLVPGRISAGRYSLRLMLAGHPDPLATVEPLVLTDGAVTAPPELNPLDLRGRLRAIGVQASNEDGLPIGVQIRHRSAGGGSDAWTSQAHRGSDYVAVPVKLYTAAAALDVEVAAEGFRTALLLGVTEDVAVKLRPGYPAVLTLRGLPRLPVGYGLAAELEPVQGGGSGASWSDFRGDARFALPVAGEYRVAISLSRNGILRTELTPTPRSIYVLDRDDEQAFVIAVDQTEIDAAERKK
jgi:hypothetical protein